MKGQTWQHHFTPDDLAQCSVWGKSRQNYGRKFSDAHGFKGDGIKAHTDGVITEYAFKLEADLRWGTDLRWIPGGSNFRLLPADVGDHYQIRSVDSRWKNLLVYKTDKPYQVYILALLHQLPVVHLAGWAHGISAHQKKWWDTKRLSRPGGGGYLYPQHFLAPMDGIPLPEMFTTKYWRDL